ncbi:hypothetical protein COOONC_28470 [Cooperia oncophora]
MWSLSTSPSQENEKELKQDVEWALNSDIQRDLCNALRSVALVRPLLIPPLGLFLRMSVRGCSGSVAPKLAFLLKKW